jgi:predicted alpha/beta-hydrolase family hydrolase
MKPKALLLTPGAGADRTHHTLVALEQALAQLPVERVDFPYRKAGRKAPDRAPVLIECVRQEAAALAERVGAKPNTIALGGRSMGGRMCSMAVAEGLPAAALVLISYPLHPPGKPDRPRIEHLPAIKVPVICFNGTRDPFCTPELMNRVLERVKTRWEMHWMEGADHSFHVPKSSGKTDAGVLDEIADASRAWVVALARGAPRELRHFASRGRSGADGSRDESVRRAGAEKV